MLKILIADDDDLFRKLIAKNLANEYYGVTEATNGKDAFDKFSKEHFDIVIADIMMPELDGINLANEIRKHNSDIPVLMLTSLAAIDDKEKAFNFGADDYMVKPVSMKELLLRVNALFRRYKIAGEKKIIFPHTELYDKTNTVTVNGIAVELTKKMFLLLYKLLLYPNQIFSREQLLNEIWGYETESVDRTIDTHIKWIRDKIQSPDFEIVTIRGLGYKAVLK